MDIMETYANFVIATQMAQQLKSATSLMEIVSAQMDIMVQNANLNANATSKVVKTMTVDLIVANVNAKMDIQEFIVSCQ